MGLKTFTLQATITTRARAVARPLLCQVLGRGASVRAISGGFLVDATVVGVDSRELNRRVLSALRKVDPLVRLESVWSVQGCVERYRGYVLIKTRPRILRGTAEA